MMDQVTVEQYHTPEHTAAHSSLQGLSLQMNQVSVLNSLTGASSDEECKQLQHRVIGTHILSSTNTLSSILLLTAALSLHVKEAIALARIYYETALVASFTCLDDGQRAKRANLYSVYKTFRTQTKTQRIGGQLVKVAYAQRLSRQHPIVKKALEEFSGGSGIRPCFSETREEMTAEISARDKTAGAFFSGVEAMIHDVSSEIIHGSFHGYEMFSVLQNRETDEVKNLMSHYEAVFISVCLSTAAFARVMEQSILPSKPVKDLEAGALDALTPFIPEEIINSLPTLFPASEGT